MPIRTRLEHFFQFEEHGTNWRTEVPAGFTTFITMGCIIFVNPAILSQTGMPLAAVTAATCLCAAFGSMVMEASANYPLALAPGMGLNAHFSYRGGSTGCCICRRHCLFCDLCTWHRNSCCKRRPAAPLVAAMICATMARDRRT